MKIFTILKEKESKEINKLNNNYPKRQTIEAILNYSKAIQVKKPSMYRVGLYLNN